MTRTERDSILVRNPGHNSPSRSQTIKNVSRHLITSFRCGLTTPRHSHLAFLQGSGSLWYRRNGWVSALSNSYISFSVCCVLMMFFFLSAINAPATGDCSFAAYLAAAKALGSNAPNVGRSLVPQASEYLRYLGRFSGILHWPSNGWCGRSGDSYAFVSH
jgi:hypothetical protein